MKEEQKKNERTGPVKVMRKEDENNNQIFINSLGKSNENLKEKKKITKTSSLLRLANLDKVRELIRKSSKERK